MNPMGEEVFGLFINLNRVSLSSTGWPKTRFYTRLALNSRRSCFCFSSAGIKGIQHHARLFLNFVLVLVLV